MLDRIKHETTMRSILDDVYSTSSLSSALGFKGGTACYFFHGLPRFSVDLDFNLLNMNVKDKVYDLLPSILGKYGEVKDRHIKTNTIFFYLVHTAQKHGIKIEISTRKIEKINSYDLLEFYGTSILVMKEEDIFANKLLALKYRHAATSRDLYDINFFFKKSWDINGYIIEKVTGMTLMDYLKSLPDYILTNFNKRTIHLGLGELLEDQAQRDFVKNKLIDDSVNRIRFYIDSYERIR
ncbi:nucleotidyl transferase AbiEii/AbiGii toxin family protein [Patescibacteria group bacterium]|nr:nucleotidyl transferase AbiEii/AbiGii toxin family protein [Patescibacteria group bacterium]